MKQRYYSYKPSGIDWIGDIPSHWDITPLKRNLRMPLKYGANEPAESEDKNYPRYIRITDIDSNGNLKDETFKSLEPSKATDYLLVKGDVLFARSGATVGKTYIFKEPYEACFAGYLIKASCSLRLSPQFLFYYTNSGMYNNWKNSIFIQSTIQNIGADKYSLLPLPLPPLAEQEAIAAWLDEKCGEIDAAIAKVDREIELIDELKQSEISRVVTRGLNPDTPLRPSGIDWIGDIPSHWKINKLKYHAEIFSGEALSTKNLTEYSEIPVYGGGNILGYSKVANTKCNTLITGRVGGDGTVRLIRKNFWATDNALIIETDLEKTFLCNILNCANLIRLNTSTAQPLLTATKIKNVEIPVPPLPEQQAIVDYLDKKCAEMDGLKAKLTKKRETLKELRQSIISEVVTGKRKII